MKKETATQALILKSTPFKENKVILQLFTEEFGPASAIASTRKSAYLSSMMHIEGTLKRGRGDMYTLTEPHIINTFPNLRTDFDLLQLATQLVNTLSRTLVPERAVPALFVLTKNTLKALSKENNDKAIYLCFLLKLLLFEGLLPLNPEDMESSFDDVEKDLYLTIATAKNFESLKELAVTETFKKSVEEYTMGVIPL
jgi:DNA repair protein RecO